MAPHLGHLYPPLIFFITELQAGQTLCNIFSPPFFLGLDANAPVFLFNKLIIAAKPAFALPNWYLTVRANFFLFFFFFFVPHLSPPFNFGFYKSEKNNKKTTLFSGGL
jgi:hypothetical protein